MVQPLFTTFCILALAAPAVAAGESKEEPARSDRKVRCESSAEIGSRLSRKRQCLTEAEWRDLRARQRLEVDKVQAQKPWQE